MSTGFITAFWSPKGGVGKTVLAVAAAMYLSQHRKTVLVDGNADNPDLVSLLQCPPEPNVTTWSGGRLEEELVRLSSSLLVLPGPKHLVDERVLTKERMESVLLALREAGLAVVVDLTCGLRDSTLVALDLADRVAVPVTLDLLSVSPLGRLVREQEFLQFPFEKFRLVVNRYSDTREILVEDLEEYNVCPVAGVVPSYRAAAAAINRFDCAEALGPASPIGKAMSTLAPSLFSIDELPAQPLQGESRGLMAMLKTFGRKELR